AYFPPHRLSLVQAQHDRQCVPRKIAHCLLPVFILEISARSAIRRKSVPRVSERDNRPIKRRFLQEQLIEGHRTLTKRQQFSDPSMPGFAQRNLVVVKRPQK